MKKSLVLLVLGVLLFFVGSLMLLQQANLVNFLSYVIPDIQNVMLYGAIIQSIGGLLVIYGAVKLLTSGLTKSYKENQAVLLSLMQRVERVEKRVAEVGEKVISMEKTRVVFESSSSASTNCRFCGAKIERGVSFCPNCGRAQK